MRLFLIAFLFFFGAVWSFGQSQIRGKVLDEQSQAPLEFASVAVYKTQDSSLVEGSITDVEGEFLIENLAPGSYFLKVSFVGFRTMINPAF